MKNKDIRIILVTDNNIVGNKKLFRRLKVNHKDTYPRNLHVLVENSHEALNTVQGLSNTIKKYETTGFVYVIKAEIKPEIVDTVIKTATNTGLPFGIVSRNNTGWTTSCVNPININNNVTKVTKITAGTTNS